MPTLSAAVSTGPATGPAREEATGPLPLYQVLAEEYNHQYPDAPIPDDWFEQRRAVYEERFAHIPDAEERQKQVDSALTGDFHRWLHERGVVRSALCFSGGGIRSATFGLGLLQGFARKGLLRGFDFLSTVSGGGYLGGWLSAWIHREGEKLPAAGGDPLQGVEEALSARPETPLRPDPGPVFHLREYSRYMSPKLGFLSADTWTLVAIFSRNLFLNWLVLLPLLAAGLMVPRLSVWLARQDPPPRIQAAVLGLAIAFGVVAIAYIIANRPSLAEPPDPLSRFPSKWRGQLPFLVFCLLPLALMAIAATAFWAWMPAPIERLSFHLWGAGVRFQPLAGFATFGAFLHLGGYLLSRVWVRSVALGELLVAVLTGALGGLLAWVVAKNFFPYVAHVDHLRPYVCLAAPLLLGLFLLAATFFVGLSSHFTSDADREWLARAGAWVLIWVFVRSAVAALVLFGPSVLTTYVPGLLSSIGGLSGVATLLLGRSPKTAARKKEGEGKDGAQGGKSSALAGLALKLAAPLFAVFVLVVLALASSYLVKALVWIAGLDIHWATSKRDPLGLVQVLFHAPLWAIVAAAVLLFVFGTLMGRFVDINRFSLHAAYRDRLIRAYLGASRDRGERKPNPFTGFDERDNVEMRRLRRNRPLHVVNMALNLVAGGNLAWQDRKAESFTITPLHAGSLRLGYRDAAAYGLHPDGKTAISLGTSVAISGAAASPNMGYHSSPVVTFLLALLNVRLGWWLGNPGPAGEETYRTPGPRFAQAPLIAEAFGLTDDHHPYVYLSDGGHFENFGLYEMVLRRCRYIVVSDGEEDADFKFEGLASAVGKIRTDFGIPILFQKILMRPRDPSGKTYDLTASAAPAPYAAIGRICYSCVDHREDGGEVEDGLLLYVKASLNGTEPVDVFNYAKNHPAFPHESTGDQLYSETQFESYRALGSHAADSIVDGLAPGAGLAELFALARDRYGEPPRCR